MRLTLPILAPLVVIAALVAGCGDKNGGGNAVTAAPNSVPSAAAPAGQDWTQVVSKTAAGGYVMGNPDAPLKLVEYGSRTCPTCGNFGRTGMQPLENQYVKAGKVSYEFRDFLVHGPPDFAASLLGRCVGEAVFFPVLEQMYVDQERFLDAQMKAANDQRLLAVTNNGKPAEIANAWADAMGYVEFMKQRGLPEQQARACLNDEASITALTKMTQDATAKEDVQGTPTFFLNGKKLDQVVTWPQVENALKTAGA